MDVKQYLEIKKEREALKTIDRAKVREVCYKCYRKIENCYCKYVKSFDPFIHFVILIHPMESRKEKVGTGRLSHLCLENSLIIEGVDFTNNKQVNELINDPKYYPCVLYPGKEALNISESEITEGQFNNKIPLMFVIDGTWPCAKKMMKLSKNLHPLPRICFTPRVKSKFEIKFQPDEMCLSTIESIHYFISEFEKNSSYCFNGKQEILLELFDRMVQFQKKCALDPNLQSYRKGEFKEYNKKKKSKKWDKYNLFYE